jgi:aquaporin Z|tara:strand:- start:190 stop:456 length:267 start_codon:yes stop_codon:yes gene_type:complete
MNKYLVEFVATAFFVYVILATGNPVAIGLALILAIMVAAPISGGHVNPAVSVVMAMANKLPRDDLLPYVIAQVAGGLAAYEFYRRVRV